MYKILITDIANVLSMLVVISGVNMPPIFIGVVVIAKYIMK
ncbi:hypothetical protein [Clostridium estertheticum]|nr:hypothetical protein [Clostridium estertheticum]